MEPDNVMTKQPTVVSRQSRRMDYPVVRKTFKRVAFHQLLLQKMDVAGERQPIPGASLNDIDEKAVQVFVKKALLKQRIAKDVIQADTLTLLKSLGLVNDNNQFLLACLLLFGKNPTKYAIGANFKIARFGQSHGDLQFQDIIEGTILEMADKVIEILERRYLTRTIIYRRDQRMDLLEYPERALWEAILNAIVHKDYSDTSIFLSVYDDRLMIWNPGKLPDSWTVEKLAGRHVSKPRNGLIAKIFYMAGYIESWGLGIRTIMDCCKEQGIPDPILADETDGIRITFVKDIYTASYFARFGLTKRQIEALLYMKCGNSMTNMVYQKIGYVSSRTALRDLQELLNKNLIERIGSAGKGTSYVLKRGNPV